ncbi:MAG TPA: O-antigen polymerase, partial [Chthoniobacterales bacterium]
VTLEKKLPRPVLVAAFAASLFLFAGLSGFTAILRQDRSALDEGNIVGQSLREAFLGDNLIDLRDAAWVFSEWDFEPLNGKTYLGGLTAMLPSGVFPQKKEWHLGLTGVRMVGWNPDEHFGLRITFFGESFLNFGPAGVVGLAVIMGCLFGGLLRTLHLISAKRPPCLYCGLKVVVMMQMCLPLANTSDAFTFWSMGAFLVLQWLAVGLPPRLRRLNASDPSVSAHAPSRV